MKVQGASCWAMIAGAAALALCVAAPARAVDVDAKNGWAASFDGELHAFFLDGVGSTLNGATDNAKDIKVLSGFNPSKFNAHLTAPTYEGLTVSGNFQYVANIGGGNTSGAGPDVGATVRVMDIHVSGSWGTVAGGRSWSIFDGSAIVADEATGGVGLGSLCGLNGVGTGIGGGTCGRIGTGYTWTAFAPRIEYDSPDLGGFGLRIGLFDPANTATEAGLSFQTKTPRIEAEATYASKFDQGAFKLWLGGLHQTLDAAANAPAGTATASVTMSGFDLGGHLDLSGFGLSANYTKDRGFGASGFKFGGFACNATGTSCTTSSDSQWYVDGSYKIVNTRIGASYGEGKQDANANQAAVKNKMPILYIHHNLTPNTILTFEYDHFTGDSNGATVTKYDLFSLGMHLYF
jgi:hypothetical protein